MRNKLPVMCMPGHNPRQEDLTHPLADGVSPKSYESRRAEFASTVHASDANYNVATGNAFARTEGITTFTVVGS